MSKLVTIRTFASSLDFEMVKAYLESYDIQVYGQDEIVNRAYISDVNGGVKLQVCEAEVERAVELLMEGGYLNKEDMEPSPEIRFISKILNKFKK